MHASENGGTTKHGFGHVWKSALTRSCCTCSPESAARPSSAVLRDPWELFLLPSFKKTRLLPSRIASNRLDDESSKEIVEPSNAIYLLSLNHLTSKDKEVEDPRKKKRKEKKIVVKFNNVGRMLEEKLLEKLSVSIVVEITLTGCYINNVSLKGHSMGITSLLGNREEFKIVIGTCSFSRPYTDSRLREGTGERS